MKPTTDVDYSNYLLSLSELFTLKTNLIKARRQARKAHTAYLRFVHSEKITDDRTNRKNQAKDWKKFRRQSNRLFKKYLRCSRAYKEAKHSYIFKKRLFDMRILILTRISVNIPNKIVVHSDTTVHVFYGGRKTPDGPNHAHIMIFGNKIVYRRLTDEPHGSRNYTCEEIFSTREEMAI